ncbi:hypothetical protein RSOL_215970, partial [Rhizoctonia solani AG-3 Rhs1AP]
MANLFASIYYLHSSNNIPERSGNVSLILAGLHQNLTYNVLFRVIDMENNATFLARGSAADVWKVYDLPVSPNNGQDVPYVSKILRISPGDFDDGDLDNKRDSDASEDEGEYDTLATWDAFVKV